MHTTRSEDFNEFEGGYTGIGLIIVSSLMIFFLLKVIQRKINTKISDHEIPIQTLFIQTGNDNNGYSM